MIRLSSLFLIIAIVNGFFGFGFIGEMKFEIAYLLSLAFFLFGLVTLISGLISRSRNYEARKSALVLNDNFGSLDAEI